MCRIAPDCVKNVLEVGDPWEDFPRVSDKPAAVGHRGATSERHRWHEVYDAEGNPRPVYQPAIQRLQKLRPAEMRGLDERMEATLREMGVNFGVRQADASLRSWTCDLLPHIFASAEWDTIAAGVRQRLKAFELFLRDVYGPREILREGIVPISPVLGSRHYQSASVGLPRPQDAYLHLSGICITRDGNGALAVKHHQLSRAAGISYMMQNRRALVRVLPEYFQENPVRSLTGTPLAIIEQMRAAAPDPTAEPRVVLLSPGMDSPVYFDHSFLARRMGIPLVRGDDLLVLNDNLYLKTVRGLKRVDVIYNRVADAWLDPLVLRRGSMLGVPGLVHCLRRGTLRLVNAVGSQLADDRALLLFAPRIIRYYLAQEPILQSVPTYWLGDIDQLEMVLEKIDEYRIRPVYADDLSGRLDIPPARLGQMIRKDASRFVAQPRNQGAMTAHYEDGKAVELEQDHLIYALRDGDSYEVFPGALTRVFLQNDAAPIWVSKDTWVSGDSSEHLFVHSRPRRFFEANLPQREVTSRVADAFYWMGRYLERTHHQAYMIGAIETLESEELNSAERKLYRPMWNRLLPPLETAAGASRRSITTRLDRYRLVLLPEAGSVVTTFSRAMSNAESVQEALSPEAWATLSSLRSLFQRVKYREKISEDECGRVARRLSETVTRRVPQFFAIASRTILGDDGWRFCEVGERVERAIITANSVVAISKSLTGSTPPSEIELSAFLRLLGTRDAYRRVYQMRAEPIAILELLWQHPEVPRSVLQCLTHCTRLLGESASRDSTGAAKTLDGIEALIHKIRRVDWGEYLGRPADEDSQHVETGVTVAREPGETGSPALGALLTELVASTLNIHHLISDGFLSHQAYIAEAVQPLLRGLRHGV